MVTPGPQDSAQREIKAPVVNQASLGPSGPPVPWVPKVHPALTVQTADQVNPVLQVSAVTLANLDRKEREG